MILLVHSDKSKIKDFIMWADVEFAMQLELLKTKRFVSQAVSIIDMSEIASISGMGPGEPLFVICHGSPYDPKVQRPSTYIDGESYPFRNVGMLIGAQLGGSDHDIELWACYGADGPVGQRSVDRFAAGLAINRKGVRIRSYVGATVTNTVATVTARDVPGNMGLGSVLIVDETRMGTAGQVDQTARALFNPQMSFDAFLKSTPNATPRDKAIKAAEQSTAFYAAFSNTLTRQKVFYPVGSNLSQPVVVTS